MALINLRMTAFCVLLILCKTHCFAAAVSTSTPRLCAMFFRQMDFFNTLSPEEIKKIELAAQMYVEIKNKPHHSVVDIKEYLQQEFFKIAKDKKMTKQDYSLFRLLFLHYVEHFKYKYAQEQFSMKVESQHRQLTLEHQRKVLGLLKKYDTEDISIAIRRSSFRNEYNRGVIDLAEIEFLFNLIEDKRLIYQDGWTPLMWASYKNEKDVVQFWLSKKVPIDDQNYEERTALFEAIEMGHLEIAQLLLEAGANPNVQDIAGKTTLFLAIELWRENFIPMLLAAGANPQITNYKGQTGVSYAQEQGFTGYAARLEKQFAEHKAKQIKPRIWSVDFWKTLWKKLL